jgi:hypothetical protein
MKGGTVRAAAGWREKMKYYFGKAKSAGGLCFYKTSGLFSTKIGYWGVCVKAAFPRLLLDVAIF